MLPLGGIGPSRRIQVGPGSLVIGLMNAEVSIGSAGIGEEGKETRSKFYVRARQRRRAFFWPVGLL